MTTSPSPADACAAALQPAFERQELAGAVALVANREGVLEVGTVGYADIAAGRPMAPNTMFWIASQTKPMLGTAFMMLVDEGKVSVDDPVEKYFPEYKGQMVAVEKDAEHVLLRPPAHPITVREVLSHTSGLPFGSTVEEPTRDVLPLWATVKSYAMLPLGFEPGTGYLYSNAGTNIAGRIIEVVSGMAFETFLQTRLLDPLGMSDTTFWPTDEQVDRMAKAYMTDTAGVLEERPIHHLRYPLGDRARRFAFPGGGLFSTAADCAKFCRMILNGGELDGRRYVSEAAVREMTARQTAASIPEGYGLGWSVQAGGQRFGHGGACSTYMAVDTKAGLVFVFLMHLNGSAQVPALGDAFERAAEARYGGRHAA